MQRFQGPKSIYARVDLHVQEEFGKETWLQNAIVYRGKLREKLTNWFVFLVLAAKLFDKLTHLSALLHQAVFEFLQSFFGLAGADDQNT